MPLYFFFLYLLTMGALVGCGGGGNSSHSTQQPTLSSLAVSPDTASLGPKATQQFTATGTFSDGSTKDLTPAVTWTSSRPQVATITAAGLATAVAPGQTTITATTSGSLSATATLTVTPPSVTSLRISPCCNVPSVSLSLTLPSNIPIGTQIGVPYGFPLSQLTATGTLSDGSQQDLTSAVTWTSSRPQVATITAAGQVTVFYVQGMATITAAVPGMVTSNPIIIEVTSNRVAYCVEQLSGNGFSCPVPGFIQSQAQGRSLGPSYVTVMPANTIPPLAYVANTDANDVSVINTATNIVVGSPLPVDHGPTGVAVTPDGTRVYVTNGTSPGTVSVIDTASHLLVATIPVGNGPEGIAITPDGTVAYVANFLDAMLPDASGTVSVIDTTSNTVVNTIHVGFEPTQVAVTPDGQQAYVANGGDGTVSVIDTRTQTVVGNPIVVGESPAGITVTPDGKKVYVTNFNSGDVSVLDTTSHVVHTTIPVGFFPLGIAMAPDGTRVYVADTDRTTNNGSLAIIDTASDTVIGRVMLPSQSTPHRLVLTLDGHQVYVTLTLYAPPPEPPRGLVVVLDTASNTVLGAPIPVGGSIPEGIALTP